MTAHRLATCLVAGTVLIAGCGGGSTTSTPEQTSSSDSVSSSGLGGPEASGSSASSPSSGPPSSSSTQPAPDGGAKPPLVWGPTVAEWRAAHRAVRAMSDAELAGQVIVARYTGSGAPTALVDQYHLGGVIVMGDNVASVSDVATSNQRLQASDKRSWPLVIAVDQEGGTVARLGSPMTDFPTFMSFGAADSPRLTRRAAQASGDELRATGFTMVFAPDADVTIGPSDPTIGSRSAGDDPDVVAAQVVAAMRGYRDAGIVSVIKHFPGHGSVTTNSHEELPVQPATVAALQRRDFVPFQAAVAAGAPAVMLGHLALQHVDPGVPADLSGADIDLLTHRLGFRGLITTDALEMAAVTGSYSSENAAVTALKAGVDMLLMPADTDAAYNGIIAALSDGSLKRSRVRHAAATVVALMMHQARAAKPAAHSIGSNEGLSRQVSAQALTLVKGPCSGPYVGGAVRPIGSAVAVRRFTSAAEAGGLVVSSTGGTSVALLGYGAYSTTADVAVSLDTPYVLESSQATVKLALYGEGRAAMRALVDVLVGDRDAPGRSPVSSVRAERC